jgi:hypothetical protein
MDDQMIGIAYTCRQRFQRLSMSRFESCNIKTCVHELMALGNNNPRMWNLFNWLPTHDELQYGTQAEIIKLYVEDKLGGYSLLENY